jgi:predicted metalloprotease
MLFTCSKQTALLAASMTRGTLCLLYLQADCFAGLWAYSIKDEGVLESNEITEAIDAAGAVGDDRIQQRVEGRVQPETWTHGSSAQRVEAFQKGYDTGSLNICLAYTQEN